MDGLICGHKGLFWVKNRATSICPFLHLFIQLSVCLCIPLDQVSQVSNQLSQASSESFQASNQLFRHQISRLRLQFSPLKPHQLSQARQIKVPLCSTGLCSLQCRCPASFYINSHTQVLPLGNLLRYGGGWIRGMNELIRESW